MKFEDIFVLWEKDSDIDKTEIADESIKIPKLHSKYYKIFCYEKIQLRQLEAELKKLHLEKYEFYTQGHTKETKEKGWELPAKGLILKGDIPMYIDSDKDMISLSLKIGSQQEKVDLLESIIKTINNRGYLLKTIVDWSKFINGG
jgi:hypothetical protein